MEHDHSDDQWGFWEPERTRKLPRVRAAETAHQIDEGATRQLDVVGPRRRRHGVPNTVDLPVVAAPASATPAPGVVDAVGPYDGADPLGLFDDLGPVDEFPELDHIDGVVDVAVVSTAGRSWRQRLRRDDRGRLDPLVTRLGLVL